MGKNGGTSKNGGTTAAAKKPNHSPWRIHPSEALRVRGRVSLSDAVASSTPGFSGTRSDAERYKNEHTERFSDLQEMLFANGRSGDNRSILLVLQGMDTAGKGGIVRHVIGQVDPQGVQVTGFGVPTPEEKAHHHLWRIRKALPRPGRIGVFDRSHYESVLVERVDELVPVEIWRGRYAEINQFERELVDAGTTVVKVCLVVSMDEQKRRLTERLNRPDKYWKYNPRDVDVRMKWPAYREAYEDALELTSTDHAPWYVVPADAKWFARAAVTELLVAALEELDLSWPPATFDIEAERERVARC